MRNFPSWQLTTTANLRPYHYEPTTLLLRTYHLTTTSPRSTKGRVKEHLWVRPRWVYGWDTNTCMGETPTPVWVRYLDSRGWANGKPQDRFCANPNGAPWVIWNKIGWKCVMLRVIPNEEWGVRKDAVEWVQRSNLFELCRAWASSAKPIRSCHAGCKHVRWTAPYSLTRLSVGRAGWRRTLVFITIIRHTMMITVLSLRILISMIS